MYEQNCISITTVTLITYDTDLRCHWEMWVSQNAALIKHHVIEHLKSVQSLIKKKTVVKHHNNEITEQAH